MEQEFIKLCSKGDLLGAQQYLQLYPDINISAQQDYAFRRACFNGHLEMAQWLYQIKPDINISVYNEWAFCNACFREHLAVAQWLQSLKPYLYVIEYDETGKYKYYYIRSKEEENWERRKYLLFTASNKEDNLIYRLPCDISKMVIGYV
jgi:hypothetical protein